MSVTPKNIVPGAQLTTGAVTYYTTPANVRTKITKLTLTNTTGTARTVTVYLVPSGGAAGDSNTITKTATVPATSTLECFECEGHVLETSDFIQALADAGTAVTIRASGLEVTK